MRHFLFCICFLILVSSCVEKKKENQSFRFHLFQEPGHLDPALSRASSASYLFYNTRRGLYKFDPKEGLIPEEGLCQWLEPLKLSCQISAEAFWSDGQPVKATDYHNSFVHLVDPKTAAPRSSLLQNLENYKAIQSGKMKPGELGIEVRGNKKFILSFSRKDPEFLHKLTSTALYPKPVKESLSMDQFTEFLSNGPYIIANWKAGKELKLIPNPYYKKGHSQRPSLRIFFIDNEMTALRLYENQRLDFLRRLPSNLIQTMKNREDFFQVPVARYDYIGFGERLQKNKNLRQAMALSIDYIDFKSLLKALGRPGCPSLPPEWMDKTPCYNFNLDKAKKIFNLVPKKERHQIYQLKVSQMGGEDIKKQAEFLQSQWKKHLGLGIEIQQVEQKVYLNELRTKAPDIFRKGVGIDRPTCLSALETFASDGKQNYMKLTESDYDNLLKKMAQSSKQDQKKQLCRQGVEWMMNQFLIIPLGQIHFSMLARPKYAGWSINSINQLDLSQLHPVP